MKALKIIGIILVVIILIVAILVFVLPTKMEFESSVSIDAPIEVVWENVNSVEDINSWSPWMDKDPNMKQEVSGEPGTIGETHTWDSENPDVGSGSSTISELAPPNLVVTDLKFTGDMESEAKAYVRLEETEDGTMATWGFEGEMPRPWNVMLLMMSAEDMIGEDYRNGLSRLKEMSEEDRVEMEKQMMMNAMESDSTSME